MNWTLIVVALIGACAAITSAIISKRNNTIAKASAQQLTTIHLEVNSRMTALLEAAKLIGHSEGVRQERDEERERQA